MNILHPPLSLHTAIERIAETLRSTSPTPRIDAEILVRHISGVSRTEIIANPEQPLSETACTRLEQLLRKRLQGEPIAYLTGSREFWSLDLLISQDTLIPRPETELLVERALARILSGTILHVADLGTGSGAIALAIAHERPQLHVVATDRSEAALAIARTNASRLGIANIRFEAGDWLTPLADRHFHMIVSNPPYIRSNDPHLQQGDIRFEPASALVAGPDGLDAIRHIAAAARQHLHPAGWLLLEHGFDQGNDVRTLLTNYGYRDILTYHDLSGHERVTEARIAPSGS